MVSNTNVEAAYADGQVRGKRQEHLTNPSVTDRSSAGIAQLATVLGYTGDPETPFRPTPVRMSFIKGYCTALTEARRASAEQEPDPEIRKYRMGIVHCGNCGCELAPDMSYRTIPDTYCNDCIEEFPELLREETIEDKITARLKSVSDAIPLIPPILYQE